MLAPHGTMGSSLSASPTGTPTKELSETDQKLADQAQNKFEMEKSKNNNNPFAQVSLFPGSSNNGASGNLFSGSISGSGVADEEAGYG